MPRKAGEVLFISQGRDTKMTSTVPGRGSTVLQLVLEALSWKKGICSCSQKGFRVAAFVGPLQSPLLQQRKPPLSQLQELTSACCPPHFPGPQHSRTGRAGSQRAAWGSSTGSITQAALERARLPGLPHMCWVMLTLHITCPHLSTWGTEMWFLILA